ncbi:MAG: hypothetical protein SGPRY_012620 [Prymnesium sp.]
MLAQLNDSSPTVMLEVRAATQAVHSTLNTTHPHYTLLTANGQPRLTLMPGMLPRDLLIAVIPSAARLFLTSPHPQALRGLRLLAEGGLLTGLQTELGQCFASIFAIPDGRASREREMKLFQAKLAALSAALLAPDDSDSQLIVRWGLMLVGGLARLAAIAPPEEWRGLAARVHDLLPGETPAMTLGFLKLRHPIAMAAVLISRHTSRLGSYLDAITLQMDASPEAHVRASAALLTGLLLEGLPARHQDVHL